MTSRSHHVTFAIGCTIVVVVTLLFLLQKTHTQLQDVQIRLLHSESKHRSLSRQFDSLYEYKERLEKSFINLKNERSSLLEIDDAAKEDLSLSRTNCDKQLKNLQDELSACRDKEAVTSLREGNFPLKPKTTQPLLAPLSVARESHQPAPTNARILKLNPSPAFPLNKLNVGDLKEQKENEAIQSPIALQFLYITSASEPYLEHITPGHNLTRTITV
ncbi:unnamed protein product [Allacma fusca]|uniref:Uncharacterized protein n=1 Tax=Allacma fusca TaxID=39272 RepID=A0A8J2PUN4_9HEXA|nr:unnamed protein product [Allacma fusca]